MGCTKRPLDRNRLARDIRRGRIGSRGLARRDGIRVEFVVCGFWFLVAPATTCVTRIHHRTRPGWARPHPNCRFCWQRPATPSLRHGGTEPLRTQRRSFSRASWSSGKFGPVRSRFKVQSSRTEVQTGETSVPAPLFGPRAASPAVSERFPTPPHSGMHRVPGVELPSTSRSAPKNRRLDRRHDASHFAAMRSNCLRGLRVLCGSVLSVGRQLRPKPLAGSRGLE